MWDVSWSTAYMQQHGKECVFHTAMKSGFLWIFVGSTDGP